MSTSIPAIQYSSYPNGFAGGVLIRDILQTDATPSRVFYVGNNPVLETGEVPASNGNSGTFYEPFSTIDYAIGQCEANNNNIVFVREGYTQTLTAASAITCDVAGIYIVGLGQGSNRPTLTFGTSIAASVLISAANVTIKNILGVAGIDGLTNPFHIQAANCTLDVEWQDASSTVEAATAILTTAAADNLKINLKYIGFPAGNAAVKAIGLVGVNNANIVVDAYGIWSTAVVNFLGTACTNIEVGGYFYVSGTTNYSKNVVDTVGGSTWFVSGFDGAAGSSFSGGSGAAVGGDDVSAVIANQAVPSADSTANALERDVVGNKTDAAVTAVGTTKSIAAYAKGLVTMSTVQSADSSNNAFAGDVVGNKTDASVYVPGSTNSLAAYAKGTANLQERVALKAASAITNGQTLFTIAGGPIQIMALGSVCATGNDATASTLQYNVTPTSGSAQTISGASASLANATAGASVTLAGTALSTAALLNANGPNLIANPGTIFAPAGTLTAVVAVGSTTGTWAHYIRYKPLAVGVTVS